MTVKHRNLFLNHPRNTHLHGVEEDGRDLAANADATRALVGHVRDVITHVPEDRVGGGLGGGSRGSQKTDDE